jgi:hypothetical protein
MANDRLYLKCTCDGKPFYLGKTLLEGYYNVNPWDSNDLDKWYDEHAFCEGFPKNFRVFYESEIPGLGPVTGQGISSQLA